MRMSVEFQINQFGRVYFMHAANLWVREPIYIPSENPNMLAEFIFSELARVDKNKKQTD